MENTNEIEQLRELLAESAQLFRFYEESHRQRGPEHDHKARQNAEIAGRIESALKAHNAELTSPPLDGLLNRENL